MIINRQNRGRHAGMFGIIILLLCVLSLLPAESPAAQNSTFLSDDKPKRHITIYGGRPFPVRHIANNYDLVITEWWRHKEVAELKKIQPDIVVLFYRDLIGAVESYDDFPTIRKSDRYFLKDARTGSRIRNREFNWYLMDMANEGYQNHIVNYLGDKLKEHAVFDGVFLDDVLAYPNPIKLTAQLDGQKATIDADYRARYRKGVVETLGKLKQRIGSKIVVINSNDEDEFVRHADGIMMEGFVIGTWQNMKHSAGGDQWVQHLQRALKYQKMGKFLLLHSGIRADDTEIMPAFLYSLGSAAILANGTTSFSFDPLNDAMKTYMTLYANASSGSAAFAEVSTDGLAWRPALLTREELHQHGLFRKVVGPKLLIVNPSTAPQQASIPKAFCKDRSGRCIATILPKSAIWLSRQP